MFDFSKLILEIRVMAEKLSTWKFILIWQVFVVMGSGYFIGQIRWLDWPPESPDNQYHLFK
ncbi:hypothetical protein [Escherichia albertii]|uniref:hypothetical protein n=1 Tax=Escherichia albertii TaxID=208962 RepID=UPI0007431B7C|nr:hypothetical protein [Escherichia albertii]